MYVLYIFVHKQLLALSQAYAIILCVYSLYDTQFLLFFFSSDRSTPRWCHVSCRAETSHLPITLRNAWNESKQLGFISFHSCLSLCDSRCSLCWHNWEKTNWEIGKSRRIQEVPGKLLPAQPRDSQTQKLVCVVLPWMGTYPVWLKPAELCHSSYVANAFLSRLTKNSVTKTISKKRSAR